MTFLRAGAVILQLLVNITALFFIVLPFTLTAVTGGTRRLDYVIPILIRGMDIFLCVALPTFARFMVKEDTFVMFYFSLLNVMPVIFTTTSIWVYCKLLSHFYSHCTNLSNSSSDWRRPSSRHRYNPSTITGGLPLYR